MILKKLTPLILLLVIIFLAVIGTYFALNQKGIPSFPIPTPQSSVQLSQTELKYRLFEKFGETFYCDPDFYPIPRREENELAVEKFSPTVKHLKPGVPTIVSKVSTIELPSSSVLKQEARGTLLPSIRPLRIIDTEFYGVSTRSLVDSGAQCSIITKDALKKISSTRGQQPWNRYEKGAIKLTFANGSAELCDMVELEVGVDNMRKNVVFVVMSELLLLYDCIIGLDVIIDFNLSIPFLLREIVQDLAGKNKLKTIEEIVDENAKLAV